MDLLKTRRSSHPTHLYRTKKKSFRRYISLKVTHEEKNTTFNQSVKKLKHKIGSLSQKNKDIILKRENWIEQNIIYRYILEK